MSHRIAIIDGRSGRRRILCPLCPIATEFYARRNNATSEVATSNSASDDVPSSRRACGRTGTQRWEATVNRIALVSFALLLIISCVAPVLADPLADEMASMNARWDAAINNADFDALLPMYTADARLMPPGAQPVTGAMAVRNFFAGRGRSVSNHKLELVDVSLIGSHAYVTSHFTATFVSNEKATPISGSTVRLLEHQSDGQWKIQSHMFVRE
jgi:ketosteroid isomerase-like protein